VFSEGGAPFIVPPLTVVYGKQQCHRAIPYMCSEFPSAYLRYFEILFFIIFSRSAAQRGLCPPRPRGFLITHKDAPQSVGLL
jgi:hypothetical protein